MKVNNTIYESLGHLWWSDDASFELTSLRYCVNPARYAWFRDQLASLPVTGRDVLDIGCGGGFLAESFARDGYTVTGLDPAMNSIAAACEHAAMTGLPIRYQTGRGEALPFSDASFDVVACCDVLEHVDDPRQVVCEIARVLKRDGIFLYDTVNRTRKSKIALIKILQDWNLGGFSQPNAHVWEQFITPEELADMMRAAELLPGKMVGLQPVHNPVSLLYGLLQIRAGKLRGAAVAEAFRMCVTDDLGASYMGWARKS